MAIDSTAGRPEAIASSPGSGDLTQALPTVIDPQWTLREARHKFAVASGYDASTYSGWFAPAWLGPFPLLPRWFKIPIPFPNTPGRRRTIEAHDLHHILTGYPLTWAGESRISAWELASGGIDRWNIAGHFFLAHALLFGFIIDFRAVREAWRLGKRCSNLFGCDLEEVLDRTVEDMRVELGTAAGPPAEV